MKNNIVFDWKCENNIDNSKRISIGFPVKGAPLEQPPIEYGSLLGARCEEERTNQRHHVKNPNSIWDVIYKDPMITLLINIFNKIIRVNERS